MRYLLINIQSLDLPKTHKIIYVLFFRFSLEKAKLVLYKLKKIKLTKIDIYTNQIGFIIFNKGYQ